MTLSLDTVRSIIVQKAFSSVFSQVMVWEYDLTSDL